MSDEKLVMYVRRFIRETGICRRGELNKADGGLYNTLRKRRLLDRLEFEEKKRSWKEMGYEEIIEHAKTLMKKKKIKKRGELQNVDSGLYQILRNRNLLDEVGFEDKQKKVRNWRSMSDAKLIEFTKKFMKEKKIYYRGELKKADRSLYESLRKRKVLDAIEFGNKRRDLESMSDTKLIEYSKKLMKEKKITGKKELINEDHSLYEVLRKRMILDKVGFKERYISWASMSDDEVVEYIKTFMRKNGITKRKELSDTDHRLYDILRRRKLLDKVGFEDNLRNWKSMSNEEIVENAMKLMKENGIFGRRKLKMWDIGLYSILRKRKLLDRVFSDIEQSKQQAFKQQLLAGLAQAADSMEQFGERR